MAITRIYSNGFENGRTADPVTNWTGNADGEPDIVSSDANTGAYCLDFSTFESCFWDFDPTIQLRVGFWHKTASSPGGDEPYYVGFDLGATNVFLVTNDAGGAANVYLGGEAGTALGTVTNASVNSVGVWRHFGFDIKVHASGWFQWYVGGEKVFDWSGDATIQGSAISRLEANPKAGLDTWTTRWDDVVIDDSTGQGSGSALQAIKLDPIFGTADHLADFLGSDADSTDNWDLVDDVPFATATYTQSGTVGDRDVYDMAAYTIPADWQVAAIIPQYTGYNLDVTGTALLTGVVVTDAGTVENAAAPSIPDASGVRTVRYTTKPGGGAWDQAAITQLKSGVKVVTS